MKRLLWLLLAALVLGAYVAGYWPEHQARAIAEADARALGDQLSVAEARVRLGGLLGELLMLTEVVQAQNYGQAQELSSRFFDDVRGQVERNSEAQFKEALETVLRMRDPITASLTKGEPAALDALRQIQFRLRHALGYPAPPPPSAAPLPSPLPGPVG